jgi:hypothetical protein
MLIALLLVSLTLNLRRCWIRSVYSRGLGWAPSSIRRTWRAFRPTLTCVWRQTVANEPALTASDIQMNDEGNYQVSIYIEYYTTIRLVVAGVVRWYPHPPPLQKKYCH